MDRRTLFWYAEFTPDNPRQLLLQYPEIASLWAALKTDLAATDAPDYPLLHEVADDPYGGTAALATGSDGRQAMALWYAQSFVIAARRTVSTPGDPVDHARWDHLIPSALRAHATVGVCELTAVCGPAAYEVLDRLEVPGAGQLHFCAGPGERYFLCLETDGTPAAANAADDLLWYDSSRGLLGHAALLVLGLTALLRTRHETTQLRESLAHELGRLEASVAQLQTRLSRANDRRSIASHRENSAQLLSIVDQRARLLGDLSFLRLQLHECQQLRLNLATRLNHLGLAAPDNTWVIGLAHVTEREIDAQLQGFELNDSRLATALESYQVVLDQQNYIAEQRRQVISAAQAAAFTVLALVLTLLQTVQSDSEQVTARLWNLVLLCAFVGATSFAGIFLFLDRGVRYDRRHVLAVFFVLTTGTGWLLYAMGGRNGPATALAGVVAGAPALWWISTAICRGLDLIGPLPARRVSLLRNGLMVAGAAGSAALGYWSTGNWVLSLLCLFVFSIGSAGWLIRRSGP